MVEVLGLEPRMKEPKSSVLPITLYLTAMLKKDRVPNFSIQTPVSYTHLTLPTIYSV